MIAPSRVSVIARSSCPAAGLVWRRPSGPWTLTVVCRATFVLQPGRAVLAAVQHLPVAGDRGYPDASGRGLYAPNDLVPVKPRADVVLVWASASRPRAGRFAVSEIDKRVEAGGFEPVPATSPARAALLGSATGARRPDDWQGRVVPDDLDPAYFNAAPPDQQLQGLRDDERIVLENLCLGHAELVTSLPGLHPVATVEGPSLLPRPLALRADTLWIDCSRGIGAVVWRGQLALDRGVELRILVDVELPQEPRFIARRPSPLQETVGIAPGPRSESAPLPFLSDGAPPPARGPSVGGGLPFLQAASAAVSPWARGRIVAPRAEPELVDTEGPPAIVPTTPQAPAETLQLLWFDPSSPPRVRREPRFKPILDAMDELPLDPTLDAADGAGDLGDREDRRDLFDMLARAEATDESGAASALESRMREGGWLVQPVVMVAGELGLVFDELETLKAMMSAAAPMASTDPQIGKLIALAQAFLGAPGVAFGPAVALALTGRIRAAAVAAAPEKQRPIVGGDLDAEVKRGLLDAQAFQRRRLLGAPHVRALCTAESALESPTKGALLLPVYLPEALAGQLPRVERFRVRMLAFVHPAMDEDEACAVALRAVALARVTEPTRA